MSRVNDMSEGRLETGLLTVSGESIDYEGVNLKGRHVVIIAISTIMNHLIWQNALNYVKK